MTQDMGLRMFKIFLFSLILLIQSCDKPVIVDLYLSGHVYYSSNNKPVNNITVSLKETVSGASYGGWKIVSSGVTDSTGYFSMPMLTGQHNYFVDVNSAPNYRSECPVERILGIQHGESVILEIYLNADTL